MNIVKIVADKSQAEYIWPVQTLGKNIRDRRESLRWSQKRLGEEAGGINVETVNRIEHDQNTTIEKLYEIAKALGVRLGELLPEEERKPAPVAAWACPDPDHHRLYEAMENALHEGVPPKAIEQGFEILRLTAGLAPLPEGEHRAGSDEPGLYSRKRKLR